MATAKKANTPDIGFETVIQRLEESVRHHPTDGLLLSGGLDTSILAALASKWHQPDCITVALKGAPAPDIEYAQKVAKLFHLPHDIHIFGDDELEEGLRNTIAVLRTFDPMEIRNSVAAHIGLKVARERGLASVMTGDGGDELFAGYSFFFDLSREQLDNALKAMWANMNFSSIPLGHSLGIKVELPLLDPDFQEFAMKMDSGLKVREEKGQVWGKWILRKAFEGLLSPEIVWRVKAPLEVGTGTTTLPSLFAARVPDSAFKRKKAKYLQMDKVNIRSKEHLVYYEIYRNVIGPPVTSGKGQKCPDCGAAVKEKSNFCRTCGAYPV